MTKKTLQKRSIREDDLLETEKIRSKIPEKILSLISSIDRYDEIDSTNSALLNLPIDQQHGKICLAEYQTAGRGRYGRDWIAPFASGLCFSLGWKFQKEVKEIQLISLLPAVALIRVLHSLGLKKAGVKWPNDLLCQGEKLAGILIEIPANNSTSQSIVIGIGINVYNRTGLSEQIQQPSTSIDQQLDQVPSRTTLAAMLITELLGLLQIVEKEGLAMIRDEWRRYDVLINTPVKLVSGGNSISGTSRGINDDGSLSVEIDGELKQFFSGEISLRADDDQARQD